MTGPKWSDFLSLATYSIVVRSKEKQRALRTRVLLSPLSNLCYLVLQSNRKNTFPWPEEADDSKEEQGAENISYTVASKKDL